MTGVRLSGFILPVLKTCIISEEAQGYQVKKLYMYKQIFNEKSFPYIYSKTNLCESIIYQDSRDIVLFQSSGSLF